MILSLIKGATTFSVKVIVTKQPQDELKRKEPHL